MKKFLSYILILVMLVSFVPATATAEENQRYTHEQMEEIVSNYEYYEDMLNGIFCSDENAGYWNMVNSLKEESFINCLMRWASWTIGESPDELEYAEMLANLLTMQSGKLAEQIETQSRFDDLKDAKDYAWDVVEIASCFLGASGKLELVTPAIQTGVEGVGVIIENVEQAKYYEVTFQDYAQANTLLDAVSRYAENEKLRNVAKSLLAANESLLSKRLEYLADASLNIIHYEAQFFGHNMSMELLKESDIYLNDKTVSQFVDKGVELKNAIFAGLDLFKGVFKTVLLAGDLGLGTSNTFNRYEEMKAMADIAGALVKANQSISVPSETSIHKLEVIQQKCDYYNMLLVTHARGEYLLYQLLTNDAGFLSKKNPKEETDAWYQGQVEVLTRYCDVLENMFVVTVPINLENLVTDAYAYDCTYTAKIYNASTGKSEDTELISTYHIPQINLQGDEVTQINNEIYNSVYPIIQAVIKEVDKYGDPSGVSEEISYHWALNNDILSLVIENYSSPEFGGGMGEPYLVYNISVTNKRNCTKSEVIQSVGFSEKQFFEQAKTVLGSTFYEFGTWAFVEYGADSFFYEQLEKTISADNIDKSCPYVNDKGELCIIARVYSLVEGDYYLHEINLIDFELSPYYVEDMK